MSRQSTVVEDHGGRLNPYGARIGSRIALGAVDDGFQVDDQGVEMLGDGGDFRVKPLEGRALLL